MLKFGSKSSCFIIKIALDDTMADIWHIAGGSVFL
jgi:hypothetical protein